MDKPKMFAKIRRWWRKNWRVKYLLGSIVLSVCCWIDKPPLGISRGVIVFHYFVLAICVWFALRVAYDMLVDWVERDI